MNWRSYKTYRKVTQQHHGKAAAGIGQSMVSGNESRPVAWINSESLMCGALSPPETFQHKAFSATLTFDYCQPPAYASNSSSQQVGGSIPPRLIWLTRLVVGSALRDDFDLPDYG